MANPEGYDNQYWQNQKKIKSSLKNGIKIMVSCDFCHGSIAGDPQVMKFETMNDFSAVLHVNLNIRENTLEE